MTEHFLEPTEALGAACFARNITGKTVVTLW